MWNGRNNYKKGFQRIAVVLSTLLLFFSLYQGYETRLSELSKNRSLEEIFNKCQEHIIELSSKLMRNGYYLADGSSRFEKFIVLGERQEANQLIIQSDSLKKYFPDILIKKNEISFAALIDSLNGRQICDSTILSFQSYLVANNCNKPNEMKHSIIFNYILIPIGYFIIPWIIYFLVIFIWNGFRKPNFN